eukprot:g12139.t1
MQLLRFPCFSELVCRPFDELELIQFKLRKTPQDFFEQWNVLYSVLTVITGALRCVILVVTVVGIFFLPLQLLFSAVFLFFGHLGWYYVRARGCMMPQGYMFLALCYVAGAAIQIATMKSIWSFLISIPWLASLIAQCYGCLGLSGFLGGAPAPSTNAEQPASAPTAPAQA